MKAIYNIEVILSNFPQTFLSFLTDIRTRHTMKALGRLQFSYTFYFKRSQSTPELGKIIMTEIATAKRAIYVGTTKSPAKVTAFQGGFAKIG